MPTRTELPPLLCSSELVVSERPDLLRRFTDTPDGVDLMLMQRTLRLRTNSALVLALAQKFFERHQHGEAGVPEFTWRIICESDPQVQSQDPPLSAFSDFGLQYVSVGQRGFLAVDLEKREAVGFLADRFVENEKTLRNNRPLDLLFCMTAPSLGLTALSGGCVGIGDRGVLVFGPPNSGKTTACYLAARRFGMEFHADHVVFLDTRTPPVHAWGDFFPAVFRPETLEFLPELKASARLSALDDLSFHYFDKSPLQRGRAGSIVPRCSIFLDRQNSHEMRLTELSREEAWSRLYGFLLFKEDQRFDAQTTAALTALAERPAYSLHYGDDPGQVATFIQKLLP